jgi:hypothetical protein
LIGSYPKCGTIENLKCHVIETILVAFRLWVFKTGLFSILLSCDFHGIFCCVLLVNKPGMHLLAESFDFPYAQFNVHNLLRPVECFY